MKCVKLPTVVHLFNGIYLKSTMKKTPGQCMKSVQS